MNEGDPGESMFIISTGEVRATVNKDGQQLPVATLRDGDFFGEMAALSGELRTATVTAVKNTEILELSREHLRFISTLKGCFAPLQPESRPNFAVPPNHSLTAYFCA